MGRILWEEYYGKNNGLLGRKLWEELWTFGNVRRIMWEELWTAEIMGRILWEEERIFLEHGKNIMVRIMFFGSVACERA